MINDWDFRFLQKIDAIGKSELIGKIVLYYLSGLINTLSNLITVIFLKFENISNFRN